MDGGQEGVARGGEQGPDDKQRLGPMAIVRRPVSGAISSMATAKGQETVRTGSPRSRSRSPSPEGPGTYWGTTTKMANIPNPNSNAARLVLHTAGIRIIFMSTIGVSERTSSRIQHGIKTAVTPKRPNTARTGPTPCRSLGHGQQAGHQPRRHGHRAGPVDPARGPDGRFGEEQERRHRGPTIITSGIQNSQWYDRCSMIGPAITIPTPGADAEDRRDEPDARSRPSRAGTRRG